MSIVTAEGVEGIHPLGEGVFSFPTAGGRVRLSVTDDALTPYGGLVPWAAFTKHIGIAENLAADCPVKRTSPNAAPVYDAQSKAFNRLKIPNLCLQLRNFRFNKQRPTLFRTFSSPPQKKIPQKKRRGSDSNRVD